MCMGEVFVCFAMSSVKFEGHTGWNIDLDLIWDCKAGRNYQGAVSIRKTVLPGMAIPMLKIRRPNGRLIFNMEIAIRR